MFSENEYADLVLACEDFEDSDFEKFHLFTKADEQIVSQLMAHGPVLLKGGRGTGKSALLRGASIRLNQTSTSACGIYLSLRHITLLKSNGVQYIEELLKILIDKLKVFASEEHKVEIDCEPNISDVQKALIEFSKKIDRRIVLFFDDAAHIGREAGLEEFFDVFRTLSNNFVSCKAAIYPGVTKFGIRFDVYNDAKVIDISRKFGQPDFAKFFAFVMSTRFPEVKDMNFFSRTLSLEKVAEILGLAVLGNVRSFIQGCSILFKLGSKATYDTLSETLLTLSTDFFWPMIEEVKMKIGMYEPLMENCIEIADILSTDCGDKKALSCIINRKIIERFSKSFEILEYVGFISKREVSRGMKSGGRGARYAVLPCIALEKTSGSRLTQELIDIWCSNSYEDIQYAENSSKFSTISVAFPDQEVSINILNLPIESLQKSKAMSYGLTDDKIKKLKGACINTVGELAEKEDYDLLKIDGIGLQSSRRIRNAVAQAIWM